MYIKHPPCKWSVNNPPGQGMTSPLLRGRHPLDHPPREVNAFYLVTGELVTQWHMSLDMSDVKCHGFCLISPCESINANYPIDKASYQKYFCFRTVAGAKSNFFPKGIPIDFEIVENMVYKQTDIFIFI